VTVDQAERKLLAEAFRKAMSAASGQVLDTALAELGWRELLAELPEVAIPMGFTLLGETGAHAPLLNDVLLHAAGREAGGTPPLPYAGRLWVVWDRGDRPGTTLDGDLPLRQVPAGDPLLTGSQLPTGSRLLDGDQVALAAGRRAVGWWLVGTGRAMLSMARTHALNRAQFGRPLASFQAVRHRLAETFVALEGAEAALVQADGDLSAMLAKAAAGQAALTAARHCQQVLGGTGFTAEHGLHRQVRRAIVLDGLLGSARELTREAGTLLIKERYAPRLVNL
jgi:alkylation response protein AidB-like acyl-CoA dehydrogenase